MKGPAGGGGYALEENPSAQHVVCVMGRGGGANPLHDSKSLAFEPFTRCEHY